MLIANNYADLTLISIWKIDNQEPGTIPFLLMEMRLFWVKFCRGMRGQGLKQMCVVFIRFDNSYSFVIPFTLDAYTHMATSDGAQVSFHIGIDAR